MRILWIVLAAAVGLLVGVVFGFGAALVVMSLGPPRNDGTYGMLEILVCVPLGAILGFVVAIVLAVRLTAA